MKYLIFVLMVSLFCGCATTQVNNSAGLKSGDCALPELTGVSCVTPNHGEISKHPFGLSKRNPIRVSGPRGQRQYLSRLICPDGRAIRSFSRSGSVGISPYGFMMDLYNVECGDKTYSVYMDMYHSDYVENKPINGFTIKH